MKALRFAVMLAALALPATASAHDSWLQPKAFKGQPGGSVPVTFFVGHHGEQRSVALAAKPKWLLRMALAGPGGSIDLLKARAFNPAAGIRLPRPATYLLSLDTGSFPHAMSPAAFASYLDEEGLSGAKQAWNRAPIARRQVRESYRRFAKSLISVGPRPATSSRHVSARLGQALEIVPTTDPYALRAGGIMASTVYFQGKPLDGAKVTLSSLARPKDKPLVARTDRGAVSFPIPQAGPWLMNVVWSQPARRPGVDYETSFSSLTFALPAR